MSFFFPASNGGPAFVPRFFRCSSRRLLVELFLRCLSGIGRDIEQPHFLLTFPFPSFNPSFRHLEDWIHCNSFFSDSCPISLFSREHSLRGPVASFPQHPRLCPSLPA